MKNKHNRAHSEGQGSNSASLQISELLPIGKDNAISTQDLVRLTGCGSARELQQYIAAERKAGAVILSSTTGGYYRPANRGETAEFCRSLENRARNTFIALRSAKRSLETPEGQQEVSDYEE